MTALAHTPSPVAVALPEDVADVTVEAVILDDDLDPGALTPPERARAVALPSGQVRRAFVATRVALRRLLAGQIGCAPDEIEVTAGPGGRPVVARPIVGMQVSIAHASGLALVAVSRSRRIGVDVERVDRRVPDTVRDLVCVPAERRLLASIPPESRAAAMLRLWVRKEAVAKADGRGIGLVVAGVDVSDDYGCPHGGPTASPCFPVVDLDVGAAHVAALASRPMGADGCVRATRARVR